MDRTGWQVTASSYVIDNPYLRVRCDRIVLPDGVVEDYYVRESRGFVIVFAVTPDQRVLLVRQYKHGIGRALLELVAGNIDDGERPEHAAARELLEETGYAAAAMEYLRSFAVEPSSANAVAHLFLAKDARVSGSQQLDPTEDITVELATLDQAREMVRSGSIDSIAHVAAIYCALERIGR